MSYFEKYLLNILNILFKINCNKYVKDVIYKEFKKINEFIYIETDMNNIIFINKNPIEQINKGNLIINIEDIDTIRYTNSRIEFDYEIIKEMIICLYKDDRVEEIKTYKVFTSVKKDIKMKVWKIRNNKENYIYMVTFKT